MSFTKNIHFRGKSAELNLIKDGDGLVFQIDGITLSTDKFPYVLISQDAKSDFWDLVREEILSVDTRKQDTQMKCTLLQAIQKQLQH